MNKLYVSLPITGKKIDEIKKKCDAAKLMYSEQWDVITPLDIITDQDTPYEECMGECIKVLLKCDAALFLSGWSESKGCNLEFNTCLIYGITTLTDGRI